MEEQVAHELMEKSMLEPDDLVFSKSQYVQQIEEQQMIRTPAGMKLIFNKPKKIRRRMKNRHGTFVATNLQRKTGRKR